MTLSSGPSSVPDQSSRLFLAVWPGPTLADRLHGIAQRYLPAGQGRVIDARNLHLTLIFLGSIETHRRNQLETGLESLMPSGFTLTLDCLGYWQRSHILWAGSSQTPDILRQWVNRLRERVSECGLTPESRPFRAHVTLARHVRRYSGIGRGGKVAARMRRERVDAIEPLDWAVSSLTLVSSETRQQGSRYTILREWPLA